MPGGPTTGGPLPPPVGLGTVLLDTAGVGGGMAGDRRDDSCGGREDLLHWRVGQGVDVGEAEISAIHFLVHSEKNWGKRFSKWLISSVDNHLWMIVLLRMSCGRIVPLGAGEVEVTVQQVEGGGTRYLPMNRVYRDIYQSQDGSEPAWPEAELSSRSDDGLSSWCPDGTAKVCFFALRHPSCRS